MRRFVARGSFVGIAENQWDFTTPGATPGFGELAEDEVRRLVAEVMGETKPAAAPPDTVAPMPGSADPEAAKDRSNQPISALPGAEPRPDATPAVDADRIAADPAEVVARRPLPAVRGGEGKA